MDYKSTLKAAANFWQRLGYNVLPIWSPEQDQVKENKLTGKWETVIGQDGKPKKNGGKNPCVNGWQKQGCALDIVHRKIDQGKAGGIGFVSGKLSNNIVALDFDGDGWQEVEEILFDEMPKLRDALLIETGKGRRHIHLRVNDLPADFRLTTYHWKPSNVVVEYRANTMNNLLPPSLHPATKQPYILADDYTRSDIVKALDVPFSHKEIEALLLAEAVPSVKVEIQKGGSQSKPWTGPSLIPGVLAEEIAIIEKWLEVNPKESDLVSFKGYTFNLPECLFFDNHPDDPTGAWISLNARGWLKYNCHHNSCREAGVNIAKTFKLWPEAMKKTWKRNGKPGLLLEDRIKNQLAKELPRLRIENQNRRYKEIMNVGR